MEITNADAFRMLFEGLYATELWSWSEHKFLEWLNSDYSGSALPMMKRRCLRMADWRSDPATVDFCGHGDNYGDRI